MDISRVSKIIGTFIRYVGFLFAILIWPALSAIYVKNVSITYHASQLRLGLFTLYGVILGFTMVTLSFIADKEYFTKPFTQRPVFGMSTFPQVILNLVYLTLYLICLNILDYFTPRGLLDYIVLWFQISVIFLYLFLIYYLFLAIGSFFDSIHKPQSDRNEIKQSKN